MTIDEFFERLAVSPHKFKLNCGRIRVDGPHCYCPINAVAKDMGGNLYNYTSMMETSASFLGLSDDDIDEIVHAADSHRARLRERMMRVTKLVETDKVMTVEDVRKLFETPSLNA